MVRKASLIIMTLVLLLMLAACGSGGRNNPSGDEQITLKIIHWQQENINNAIKEINQKFEDKYPNVKVQYDTVPPDATYDQLMQTRINAKDTDILALKTSFIGAPED